ncbi:hypothetical protein AVEN_254769-1 [Araneus ventricosus]|uniref:Uncharacterized protein n=1 Tax=Araneus ventricosus TaxID=182803 RepID=A0A4Y2GCT2_ARAVE|nr:hypothetical protein AVEN_254769-1 [Araneus ventricosus]
MSQFSFAFYIYISLLFDKTDLICISLFPQESGGKKGRQKETPDERVRHRPRQSSIQTTRGRYHSRRQSPPGPKLARSPGWPPERRNRVEGTSRRPPAARAAFSGAIEDSLSSNGSSLNGSSCSSGMVWDQSGKWTCPSDLYLRANQQPGLSTSQHWLAFMDQPSVAKIAWRPADRTQAKTVSALWPAGERPWTI